MIRIKTNCKTFRYIYMQHLLFKRQFNCVQIFFKTIFFECWKFNFSELGEFKTNLLA